MLAPLIKVEIVDELRTKTVLGKHAFYGHPYDFSRLFPEHFLRCREALPAGITRMADILLVSHFVSSEPYLVRIDDDDIVSAVHVRSIARFVLTAKNESYSGSKTAEHQVGGIDNDPLFLDIASFERYCFVTLCVHCLDL